MGSFRSHLPLFALALAGIVAPLFREGQKWR
jgi:hypothetical protein